MLKTLSEDRTAADKKFVAGCDPPQAKNPAGGILSKRRANIWVEQAVEAAASAAVAVAVLADAEAEAAVLVAEAVVSAVEAVVLVVVQAEAVLAAVVLAVALEEDIFQDHITDRQDRFSLILVTEEKR